MVFVSYCPKSSPKPLFEPNKNQHPILNPCAKFELNWLRNKKATENLIFDGTSGLKLEMTLYSDNVYDVTNVLLF